MEYSAISKAIREVDHALSPQIHDIRSASSMSALILSVCLLDTLAGFYGGYQGEHGTNAKRFKRFTAKYLPEYAGFLYELRNGLVHSFTNPNDNFMFVMSGEFFDAFPNLARLLDKQIFNVHRFKEAVLQAYGAYLEDLGELENAEIRENFLKRYVKFGIIKDAAIGIGRNLKGEIVSHIDQADRLPGTDIPFIVGDKIQVKK